MKITYRIPNKPDMFAYLVELECDETEQLPSQISSATIAEGYDVFSKAFKPKEEVPGLSDKEFNKIVEEYLTTNKLSGGVDVYNSLNEQQKYWIQTTKKAVKRLEAKIENQN